MGRNNRENIRYRKLCKVKHLFVYYRTLKKKYFLLITNEIVFIDQI